MTNTTSKVTRWTLRVAAVGVGSALAFAAIAPAAHAAKAPATNLNKPPTISDFSDTRFSSPNLTITGSKVKAKVDTRTGSAWIRDKKATITLTLTGKIGKNVTVHYLDLTPNGDYAAPSGTAQVKSKRAGNKTLVTFVMPLAKDELFCTRIGVRVNDGSGRWAEAMFGMSVDNLPYSGGTITW